MHGNKYPPLQKLSHDIQPDTRNPYYKSTKMHETAAQHKKILTQSPKIKSPNSASE